MTDSAEQLQRIAEALERLVAILEDPLRVSVEVLNASERYMMAIRGSTSSSSTR